MGMLLTITIPGSEERTVTLIQELVTLLRKYPGVEMKTTVTGPRSVAAGKRPRSVTTGKKKGSGRGPKFQPLRSSQSQGLQIRTPASVPHHA
jgi:hypothetical protein